MLLEKINLILFLVFAVAAHTLSTSKIIVGPFLINKRANVLRKPAKRFAPRCETTKIDLPSCTIKEILPPVIFSSLEMEKTNIEPLDKEVVQNQLTSPKAVIKKASNDHTLSIVNRKRLMGKCVYCLKKPKVDKKKLPKVVSFCPKCPEGCWMCEACFDEIHMVKDSKP